MSIASKSTEKKKYLFFISQDYSFPVLRPLQIEILKRGDEIQWFYYGNEIGNYLTKDELHLETIDDVIAYAPDAVFVPGNVVPSFIPGLKVQVFHGLPSTKSKKNGELYHYIIRGMFDLYCTQGPSSTGIFKSLAEKYKYFNVAQTGWCKLDPLFPIEKNKTKTKTIFFASTFSPRFSKAKVLHPFIVYMIEKYDYHWYITLHPKMNANIVALYKSIDSDKVTFIESIHVMQGLKASDIMLCDTSSIIYEFLTQQKPVITYQTQKDEPHLINVRKLNQLEETINSTFNNPLCNKKNIHKSVNNFHPYTDGKSSLRVLESVDKLLRGVDMPTKRKPLNIIRNFKLRKELNYWKMF